jgi:penicillin-binding protein 1A
MAFIRPGGFRITLLGVALLVLVAGAGGYWFHSTFIRDLPDLHSISDFRPRLASKVLDREGRPVGEFYTERRYIAPFETIPEHTRLAFVAAEDQNFFEHSGIDYAAILRAAWVDLRARQIKEGASTITMQLVKQMLLNPERKFRRKIREMILAKQIESRFSKDEILFLYLNQIYYGHGAWGIGEAARSYFGKHVSELSISESAMLAGLPQRPSEYSPFRDPEAAEKRRQSVVRRMLSMGAIDEAGAEEAMADIPVLASDERNPDYAASAYFTEEVRRYLYERLGGEMVNEGGLVIETTVDLDLQRVAVQAIKDGLAAHDRRYGYRGHVRRVDKAEIEAEIVKLAQENELLPPPEEGAEEGAEDIDGESAEGEERVADVGAGPDENDAALEASEELAGEMDGEGLGESPEEGEGEEEEDLSPQIPADEPVLGVVVAVDRKAKTARVSFAPELEAEVHLADVAWARKPAPKQRPRPVTRIRDIFRVGDVANFMLLEEGASLAPYPEEPEPAKQDAELDEGEEPAGPPPRVTLYQVPKVEGALLSIETATGDVISMVGGRDQSYSEFNRATQALRQPGSSFKPFIYGAALSRGYTPVSILYDRPIVVEDRDSGFVWRPRNYSRHFFGPMPMRRALAKSVNNATVHLFRDVGVDYVIDYARRLGIQAPLSRDLTLALGSSDVSLLELTSAYAVFPNRGKRVIPRFIRKVTDRDGQVLLEDVALGNPPPPVLKPLLEPDAKEEDLDIYPDGEILPTDRIVSEAEAFLMCDLLKAVVNEGTGRGVKRLRGYLGGKTGTTNDQADAWFMGFSPDVTTGVWVGYDSVKLLGWGETGAKAALPIWRDYMQAALASRAVRDFDAPEEIVYERIDPETGLLADATTKNAYFQPFLENTAPTEFSSKRSTVSDTRRSLRDDAFQ